MKYYLAYGSNLNKGQMAHRCPDAVPVCTYIMQDYHPVFRRGYLTIEPKKGAVVPCGIWQISDQDEKNLDRYEGYPRFYRKEAFPVMVPDPEELTGKLVTALAYIMQDGYPMQVPTADYFYTVLIGYRDFGLDKEPMIDAYSRVKWPECYTTDSTTKDGHG